MGIMKKLMKLIVLVASAAMALVSCQKNEVDAPGTQDVHFTVIAGIETKTMIADNLDGTYTPSWAKGDKIGVAFDAPGKNTEFENTANGGLTATFEGKYTFNLGDNAEVSGNMYAFYPSSKYNKVYDNGEIRIDLAATQYPTSSSFDPLCDLLIAKPSHYVAEATGTEVEVRIEDMYFARMMSVLKINLKSEYLNNEVIKSISFKAEGQKLSGAMRFNLDEGALVGNQSTGDLSEIKAIYTEDPIAVAGEKNSAYLVLAPVIIPSGTNLTFTIETENYDIVKTAVAQKDMEMPAGNIAVINLNILENECKAKVQETRIWVEGFDSETVNKQQTAASESGVSGTGVSEELKYVYSADNCNIRINSNGQTASNPYLYINAAGSSFTASNIKVTNVETLALSAMVKGNGLNLTVEYKESLADSWSFAGVIKGTSAFASGRVLFAVPNTLTSLDIKLTGSGVMYIDDIVLEETDEEIPEVTLQSISVSGQKTSFVEGDSFEFGGIVTATYTNGSTKDVTNDSEFSGYDMATLGEQTVTVTYDGKSAEYTITVTEQSQGGGESSGGYTVIKSVDELSEGTYIIGGNNQNTYAEGTMYIWSDASNVSGQKLKTTAVNFSNNDFSSDVSSFVHIELIDASIANTYYIKVGAKYLKGAEKVWSLVDDPVAWTFADMPSGKDGMYFYNTSNVSYVSINSTTDAIRTYNSNTKYKGIYLFEAN